MYFARPDSLLYGREVHGARRRMGELLASQAPVDADLVMGVPESGMPAAEGYAAASGIPYGQGLVKNRYIGRTFIAPDQAARVDAGVRRKLNPLPREHRREAHRRRRRLGRAGHDERAVVRMLREAGAAEVHLRISSPPLRVAVLLRHRHPRPRASCWPPSAPSAEMAEFLDVDSLEYLSLDEPGGRHRRPGGGLLHRVSHR